MTELSIIVPAYNEEKRMRMFLTKLVKETAKLKPEIIVINDGSTDKTSEIAKEVGSGKKVDFKVISYKNNKGKGHAVKKGVSKSKGEKIIFIDADGSIEPKEIYKMSEMLNKHPIVIGNRYNQKDRIKQIIIRKITAKIFNLYVKILFNLGINDSLCGFKGFRKDIAHKLFKKLESYRWEFDVEILYKAKKQGIKITPISIDWKYMSGSKMSLFAPIGIFIRIAKLRLKL